MIYKVTAAYPCAMRAAFGVDYSAIYGDITVFTGFASITVFLAANSSSFIGALHVQFSGALALSVNCQAGTIGDIYTAIHYVQRAAVSEYEMHIAAYCYAAINFKRVSGKIPSLTPGFAICS